MSGTGTSSTALVEGVYRDFGRVDVLVNNAGMSPLYGTLTEVTEELFDKVIGVNLKGPFRLAALVGERMVAGGGGSIINVSSHRRRAADAATSCPTPRPRPASTR